MESLVPSFCQDVYHFMDLVDAIRNPTFNLPMITPYGRFKYLLEQLAELHHASTFLSLDPKLALTTVERRTLCLKGDTALLSSLSGRLVMLLDMTTDEIMELKVKTLLSRIVSSAMIISCSRWTESHSPSRIDA